MIQEGRDPRSEAYMEAAVQIALADPSRIDDLIRGAFDRELRDGPMIAAVLRELWPDGETRT